MEMPPQRNANDPCSITLPVFKWNIALKVLRKHGKYDDVAEIIWSITAQGNAGFMPEAQPPANGPQAPQPFEAKIPPVLPEDVVQNLTQPAKRTRNAG